ncbi:hypothetical protein [Salibaculum griseiflavum]|nr:hypothetical protein [Salibaculum griseiflavum]
MARQQGAGLWRLRLLKDLPDPTAEQVAELDALIAGGANGSSGAAESRSS